MDKYATVTVHVNPAPGTGEILGQYIDLPEGDYYLVPVGEQVLTVKEVMGDLNEVRQEWLNSREAHPTITERLRAKLEARAQPVKEEPAVYYGGAAPAKRMPSVTYCEGPDTLAMSQGAIGLVEDIKAEEPASPLPAVDMPEQGSASVTCHTELLAERPCEDSVDLEVYERYQRQVPIFEALRRRAGRRG